MLLSATTQKLFLSESFVHFFFLFLYPHILKFPEAKSNNDLLTLCPVLTCQIVQF